MMFLQGKRVLFFSAQAFGIPENIISAMRKMGAIVDYFDERPTNTFFVKALIRINRNLLAVYINKYHKRIIDSTARYKYDYIFFIKGESISEHNVRMLRKKHPEAKLIIYHWDSIANNKNALHILPVFDKAYSFDKPDCERFGMTFLPLFYYRDYEDLARNILPYDYDLMFVGTTHSDRYSFIKKITTQISDFGGKSFIYFFFHNRILFYKMKLQNKSMRHVPVQDVYFKSVDKQGLLDLYGRSRIIIDVQHPKQTGLTMRCFEALGAKRKLITTNTYIQGYDFYHPDNILIVDRQNPVIPASFYNAPYREIPDNIYAKYSLDNWIKIILG